MESAQLCEIEGFEFVAVKEEPCDFELEYSAVGPVEFIAAKEETYNLEPDKPVLAPNEFVAVKEEPPSYDPDEHAVAPVEFIAVKEEPSDDTNPDESANGQVSCHAIKEEHDIRSCDVTGTTSSKGFDTNIEDNFKHPKLIHQVSKRETDKQYICSTCLCVFSTKYSIIIHVFTHLKGIEAPPHICKLCGLVVTTAESLSEHSKATAVAAASELDEGTTEMNLYCLICREAFRADGCLQVHMEEHNVHGLTSLKTNTNGVIRNNLYKCDVCGVSCVTLDELKAHKCTKNILELYDCKLCTKYFETSSSLDEHYRTHEGEKYRCQTCGRCFKHYHNLVIHTRAHTGEKPYVCDICNKAYARNQNLRDHKVAHEKEMTFACEFCGKCFSRQSPLNVHRRIHLGEKPYICDICHNGFTKLSNLKQHRLTHTGERPHFCDLCGKSFRRSNTYKRHKKLHFGVKA